jgi:5-oxopent-3-ene-1,2,5-tricarboxylate decarboxylase/2-hydroxyhepta-2,4-diene-1,7-dioate isomerase
MRYARIRPAGRTDAELVRLDPHVQSAEFTGFEPIPADGWLPPTTGLVYGVILNDRSSLATYGERMRQPPHVKPPVAPVLYIKPYNTHAGHQAVVELPRSAAVVEIGATLGVVFGATCGRAATATALDTVRGYTLAIDLSVPKTDLYRPPILEKCFDHSCVLGPWVVDRGEIPDPSRLTLRTLIDNSPAHTRTLDDLLRPVPQLIADISEFMSFYAGDVLLVGYPLTVPTAGAGAAIGVECDGIGRLECRLTSPAEGAT